MRRQPIPPKGAEAGVIKSFLDSVINYDSVYRINLMKRWIQNKMYVEGEQWIVPSRTEDPTRTPHWTPWAPRNEDEIMPTPVQNEMVGPIQNESARLVRPRYEPYVRPDDPNDVRLRDAAQVSKDVLQDILRVKRWTNLEHRGANQMVDYGIYALRSWWEIDYREQTRVPIMSALACPNEGCDFKTATRSVDESMVGGLPPSNALREIPQELGEPKQFSIEACPTCPDHPPLQHYIPLDQEAKTGQDHFGRSLGQDLPLGNVQVELVSPFDLFPSNQGVGYDETTCEEWGQCTARDLYWISARYRNGYKVKAEQPQLLMRYHPIVGGERFYWGGGGDADPGMFDHHARVREWHRKPYIEFDEKMQAPRLNRGRSLVMGGDTVLLDDDYMIESLNNPGVLIERVHYDSAVWEIRDGEYFGLSLAELLIPMQDAINEIRAQQIDARERLGNPALLVEESMDLQYAGWYTGRYGGGGGKVYRYKNSNPMNPQKPEPFGGQTMPAGADVELDKQINAIARISGNTDVEKGEAPPNISAASALQILAEKSSERRQPRIDRIREMYSRVWSHMLELVHEFVREPRNYYVKGADKDWKRRVFTGLDLQKQTSVVLEPEPSTGSQSYRREVFRDLMNMGLVDISTAAARARASEELGMVIDVNPEMNIQVDKAAKEYINFTEQMREPWVDTLLDDSGIHYQQHALDMNSEGWNKVELEAQWTTVLPMLSDWENVLGKLEAEEAAAEMREKLYGQMVANAEMNPDAGIMLPPPPPPGPPPLPKNPEQRIIVVWTQMLLEVQFLPEPGTEAALKKVLRFRAHAEAHRRVEEAKQAMVATGLPKLAAPGAPQTPTGTMPIPGQGPISPGAGLPGSPVGPGPGPGKPEPAQKV